MVDFVFQLAGTTYRFTRSQSQYAARGTGALKTKETHACYRMEGGEWELLLSGAESRVREKAEEILGLTCEQFSQVIVLPQGDFLKLLLSSSRDKAQMFQTLFATGRWERAARNLKEMAAALGKQAGELEAAKRSILEREGVETLPLLEEKEAALREQLVQAKAAQEAAEKAFQNENAALRAAEALSERFAALEQQQTQQARAAAQVAYPRARLQPGEAAQQKGVGAGAEQGVVADEGQPARAEGFPVVQVDPSMDDIYIIIMEERRSCNGGMGVV